jgi:hypothetical protein
MVFLTLVLKSAGCFFGKLANNSKISETRFGRRFFCSGRPAASAAQALVFNRFSYL